MKKTKTNSSFAGTSRLLCLISAHSSETLGLMRSLNRKAVNLFLKMYDSLIGCKDSGKYLVIIWLRYTMQSIQHLLSIANKVVKMQRVIINLKFTLKYNLFQYLFTLVTFKPCMTLFSWEVNGGQCGLVPISSIRSFLCVLRWNMIYKCISHCNMYVSNVFYYPQTHLTA